MYAHKSANVQVHENQVSGRVVGQLSVCLFEERSGFKTANYMPFFFLSGPGVNYSGCQITWAKFCKVSHRVNSIHEAAS